MESGELGYDLAQYGKKGGTNKGPTHNSSNLPVCNNTSPDKYT